ncbi:hypothetical protein D1871_07910 [Nakamurella silvestris]|nr:hypothetical protein D1871_07910 [Nakamurella silvestris]
MNIEEFRIALREQENHGPDPDEVWEQVRSRLEQEAGATTSANRNPTRRTWTRPLIVAAAVVLATSAIVFLVQHRDTRAPAAGTPAPVTRTSEPAVTPSAGVAAPWSPVVQSWTKALTGLARPVILIPAVPYTLVGEWEDTVHRNNMAAVWAGKLDLSELGDGFPAGVEAVDEVRWPNGNSRSVTLAGPHDAAEGLAAYHRANNIPCGCRAITLQDPELVSMTSGYPDGIALPAWSFAVKGSKVRVTWVALRPAEMVDGAALDRERTNGGEQHTARVAADGSITVSFTGGAPGTGGCASRYTGDVVETDDVVAVLVEEVPRSESEPQTCNALGYPRTVSITPASPLGGRVLIDGVRGYPLQVTTGL